MFDVWANAIIIDTKAQGSPTLMSDEEQVMKVDLEVLTQKQKKNWSN